MLHLPSTTLSFFRMGVPTLIMLAYFLIRKRKLLHHSPKLMLLSSVLNAVRMFFYFFAYNTTSIGNAVIILFTWPIFAALFGWIFLKEKIPAKHSLLLLLSFVGMVFVFMNKQFSFADKDFLGMSAMLLSAAVYSLTVIIFKKESRYYDGLEGVFWQNVVGAVVFLPFLFINTPFPNPAQVGGSVVFGFLIGVVGFALFFSGLKKVSVFSSSILAYIEAVGAVLIGVIFFKEVLTWNVILGGCLIISSSLLLRVQKEK
jgi:drug/metabolite transporter (DMT)-like permease